MRSLLAFWIGGASAMQLPRTIYQTFEPGIADLFQPCTAGQASVLSLFPGSQPDLFHPGEAGASDLYRPYSPGSTKRFR